MKSPFEPPLTSLLVKSQPSVAVYKMPLLSPPLRHLEGGSTVVMATDHNDSRETLPPPLDSSSDPPPLFDGTTRLYMTHESPFAQQVWIVRNLKGLQSQIRLVLFSVLDRPAWYREKVYAEDKMPALEHNGRIIGKSLDIMRYIDQSFEGPSLFPTDPEKKEFGEELWPYCRELIQKFISPWGGETVRELAPFLDRLEAALHKFDDGPFFLGQLSLVDVAYIPLLERIQIFFLDVWKHEITAGRPKVAAWMEEMNKIEAYTQTKCDPRVLIDYYLKRHLMIPQQASASAV